MKRFKYIIAPVLLAIFFECNNSDSIDSDTITEEPDYSRLIFEEFTANSCDHFSTIDINDIKVENNVWNAGALTSDSFSQCIYSYEDNDISLMGWQWQYPNDAFGVNAYPQLIYGWKPWQPESTTQELPKQISDLSRLKITYDTETTRNNGDYNLAFDNWINTTSDITPQNISYEFMIWEDANNLVPFGDFQENVITTNGTYKFYMGNPDWEPEGSDWIYLCFQRITNRTQGTVDVDELLVYLVNEGIVPSNHYLGSIEFGNEIGNSTGQTIIKNFNIDLE